MSKKAAEAIPVACKTVTCKSTFIRKGMGCRLYCDECQEKRKPLSARNDLGCCVPCGKPMIDADRPYQKRRATPMCGRCQAKRCRVKNRDFYRLIGQSRERSSQLLEPLRQSALGGDKSLDEVYVDVRLAVGIGKSNAWLSMGTLENALLRFGIHCHDGQVTWGDFGE